MNRRISIALAAALVISAGCTYALARKLKAYAASQQRQVLRYVSPRHPLEAGAVLQAADLDWTEWPLADALHGAVLEPDVAVGRVVLYPVEPGQPLLERDLAAAGIGGGLGSKIPAGMRAVALRSDEVVGVAGFLAAGSHLDVLVTYRAGNASEQMTATVVQNAQVLAAGQQAEPDPAGKPAITTVVTLLLTPLDAERAVAASTQGIIHFVLRNTLDNHDLESAPVSLSWLSSASSADHTGTGPGTVLPAASPRKRGNRAEARVETVFGSSGGSSGGSNSGSGGDGSGSDGQDAQHGGSPDNQAGNTAAGSQH